MTRVLIVDDDQDIARILRFRLQKKGFECVLAGNGVEALEKFDALIKKNSPVMNEAKFAKVKVLLASNKTKEAIPLFE